MTATDLGGLARSYLATEENFQFMKDLESRNLLVPVVGNFGGPKAIRAVGRYLKDRGRDRVGVLPVERRAVSPAGRHLGQLLRERRDAAARRHQHVHPLGAPRATRRPGLV